MMGVYFDGPGFPDAEIYALDIPYQSYVLTEEQAQDFVNSVGNDSFAAFMNTSIAQLIGKGIKNLQIAPDITI